MSEARGRFDIEVLVRLPGQRDAHRLGWIWAPMQIMGDDRLGRNGIHITLGPVLERLQDAVTGWDDVNE